MLADFYIQLHSANTELATSLFLKSWDEDHVRAMTIIGTLIYSNNGGRVLECFIRALLESHPDAHAEVERFLTLGKIVVRILTLLPHNFFFFFSTQIFSLAGISSYVDVVTIFDPFYFHFSVYFHLFPFLLTK